MKEERKRILVVVVKWRHGVNGLFTAETFAYQFFSLKVAIEWKILQLEVSDEIMNLNYTSIIFNKSSDIMIPLICVGCSVSYWVSCANNKGGYFGIAFSSSLTHICLTLKCLLTFCLTLTRSLTWCFLCLQRFAEVWYSVFALKVFIFQKVCWIFVKSTSICVCCILQSVHLSEVCC